MIVVTGGAGFIGSNLIKRLNEKGYSNIIIVDHLNTGDKWKNINGLNYEDFYEKDKFYNLLVNEEIPFNMDAVIHLGACSSTTEKDADYLVQNNYKYSLELVRYCLLSRARFIYASSAATYGDGANGYLDDENGLSNLRPLNMYGYSKHMFDLWARKNDIANKIVGLKYFNVYGPNEYHKGDMRSVVHKAFEQIKNEGKVKLFKSYNTEFKDGEQMRDFIYVKDAVEMTLYFLENRDIHGVFNIGTGISRTWNDLVTAIFNSLNLPVNIEYIDMPDYLKGKYQYYTKADNTKLLNAGYNNKIYSLEEGVNDYVKNYLLKEQYVGLCK
ncbi:MAG TPA: ADP-glyceromanno-heptose 6-epimerase [Melioribacteraceae bacterium]|nr:ADP-glyceromanno-heptose 6-epimerase [Melioribacteraceae bacterium]